MSLFTITFTDNEEILHNYHHGVPTLEKQPIGTCMLAILNADIDRLEFASDEHQIAVPPGSIVSSTGLPIAGLADDYQKNYEELKEEFPFISVYSAYDWYEIRKELDSDIHRLRSAIDVLIQVIEITSDHPEYLNYRFMSTYLINEALGLPLCFKLQIYESGFQLSFDNFNELSKARLEERMEKLYNYFIEKKDQDAFLCYEYSEISPRLEGIMVATFLELVRRNKVVRRCKNCGRYFIPENRSDTLYCDNSSPDAPEMTCKEYGTRRLWYERQKEDELATLSRKIASAKGMLAKRNPDIPAYAVSYEYFKAERLLWKKAVDEGRKTKEEYREWLLLMQSQKVIKEAIRGNDGE